MGLDELALLQCKNRVISELDRHCCSADQGCSIPAAPGSLARKEAFEDGLRKVSGQERSQQLPHTPEIWGFICRYQRLSLLFELQLDERCELRLSP